VYNYGKTNHIKGEMFMFSKNMRAVYLYAVCFITLMMMIGGVIATVNAITQLALPTTSAWQTTAHLQRNFINSIAVWAIAAPIFALHWWAAAKLTKKEEDAEDAVD